MPISPTQIAHGATTEEPWMSGSAIIDAFFEVVREQMVSEIDKLDLDVAEIRHWVIIQDSVGVAASRVADGEPHELLQSFLDGGADAAAYVTYVPGFSERLLAYAWVAKPRNSDIRQCILVRDGGSASLGPWQYML
jgi:hypothetical protein